MNSSEYLARCYAAWLGKVIGIRLGAPVENKTAAEIRSLYPVIDGYLVDYGCFAADDDSNGPLFYVRALEDARQPLDRSVGEALLSYISEYSGFFWWGGVGISTEHTAYENLKNGLLPPQSGSAAQNGSELSEQIGGQIFSDCWGYVASGNPTLAADMAAAAASVTHDGLGIEGARFIAAAVAAAFTEKSIAAVIDRAMLELNPDLAYAKMLRDIIGFCHTCPDEPDRCLKYIEDNYGYDRFGGVCHIIPNSALIIMALCYGGGEFEKTICLLCSCGWDTDCNCGNAGSILGALCGLSGIPQKWITPINDLLIASSSVGCLNNQTVSESARSFAAAGQAIAAGRPADFSLTGGSCFVLPYETRGFFCEGGRAFQGDGALNLEFSGGARLLKRSYFLPGDLYDTRYEPTFAPLAYPGERLSACVEGHDVRCRVVCRTCDGLWIEGEPRSLCGKETIEFSLPAGGYTVRDFGIAVDGPDNSSLRLITFDVDRRADFTIDTAALKTDDYGPTFGGGRLITPRGFTVHSGSWSTEGGLCCEGRGLITTGDPAFSNYRISCSLEADGGGLVFAHRNSRCYFAAELSGNRVEIVEYERGVRRILLTDTVEYEKSEVLSFTISLGYDKILYEIENKYINNISSAPHKLAGGFGLLSHNGGFTKCHGFSLRPL